MQIKTNILPQLKEWFLEKSTLITSWNKTASDEQIPSEKLVKSELDTKETITNVTSKINSAKTELNTNIDKKVDKTSVKTSISSSLTNDDVVGGKALYDKISEVEAGIPDGMTHENITDWDTAVSGFEKTTNRTTSISTSASDSKYPTEKAVKSALDTAKTTADSNYAAKSHTHTTSNISNWSTATSGFEVSSNKATDLSTSSDAKYPTTKAVNTALSSAKTTADNTYATKTALSNGLAGKVDTTAKTTSVTNTSSDNQIPSAKAVFDLYNSIPKWTVEMVGSISDLPATGEIGTIYLISDSGSGKNQYKEFFWNDSADEPGYEQFGGVELDVSKFITKKQMTDYLANNSTITLSSTGELALNITDATE